jgi:hypothetical protein
MSAHELSSSDLERFKREAKKTRRLEGITHLQALDAIARREGFPDWWHLQHAVERSARPEGLPEPGKARTARASLDGFLGYLKLGDVPAACSFLVEPERTLFARVSIARTKALVATDALCEALDEKFGPGSAEPIRLGVTGQVEPLFRGIRERALTRLEENLDARVGDGSATEQRAIERLRQSLERIGASEEIRKRSIAQLKQRLAEKIGPGASKLRERARENLEKFLENLHEDLRDDLSPAARFVEERARSGDPLEAIARGVEVQDVTERGDQATARILKRRHPDAPPVEDTIELERKDGFWFAHGPKGGRGPVSPSDEPFVRALAASLESTARAWEGLASEIESGSVGTKEAAYARVMMFGGGGFPGAPSLS